MSDKGWVVIQTATCAHARGGSVGSARGTLPVLWLMCPLQAGVLRAVAGQGPGRAWEERRWQREGGIREDEGRCERAGGNGRAGDSELTWAAPGLGLHKGC